MSPMTTKERVTRMFEHREADRVPVIDRPWQGTLNRWHREGMPASIDWRDYFDIDKCECINIDISPRYEHRILEETDRYVIQTSPWGVTTKDLKEEDATPEFLDFTITTPEKWEEAKARMTVDRDRIDWAYLQENYPRWKAEGRWIQAGFWFGFDVTHSWMCGTETLLIALMEEPEWVKDMFNTYLDRSIAHFDMLWDAGYTVDSIFWYDDMGYKGTPFFSEATYRELLQPVHKRAVDWAHAHGIRAHLHSCGDIMPLIPAILETGVDALNPIEIKAGKDIYKLKKEYGDRLVLHGGVDASRMDRRDEVLPLLEQLLPVVKENGGYIFSSDHSIPNAVSLDTYQAIIDTVKKHGAY
ncbi:MAG TPA: hypothetical protein H9674_09685 [Firmicutes bacterium]|nr:hypothetical protein [Bacillota bacterium]